MKLKEELESKIKQREGCLDQLKLVDVTLDKMDKIIKRIDRDAQSHIDALNPYLTAVADAYKARVDAGCRSGLEWVVISQETRRSKAFVNDRTVTKYECKEIESLARQENYHGMKYYSKPSDMDYGSSLIGEFFGLVSAGSTVLGIHTQLFEAALSMLLFSIMSMVLKLVMPSLMILKIQNFLMHKIFQLLLDLGLQTLLVL